MPNRWETPGGACDLEDVTILHGAARELWEETGLRAQRIVRSVGDGFFFKTRRGLKIWKFSFEAEVETVAGREEPKANDQGSSISTDKASVVDTPKVKLDPEEHQNFVWASEDDVLNGRSGDIELIFTHDNQRDVVLKGFELRKGS
jgi:8-oxo-dGTP pyrophosphatase MutT (NUDIX family)